MGFGNNKKYWVIGVVLLLLGAGTAYYFFPRPDTYVAPVVETPAEPEWPKQAVIGQSVEGRTIETYTFGDGENKLLFVGGIHGGYEWNSVFLAYRAIDHLKENLDLVGDNVSVTIIPALNPDGLYKITGKAGRFTVEDVKETGVVGTGRFNANSVDLNRNFDCKWKPESTWRGEIVSAGTAAFSEPEAKALRDYVLKEKPKAVVFWHSQANAVYASECEKGILPATLTLMNLYAKAAGYPSVQSFDAYPVSGDAEGWLASIGIPAITVELATHETIEWAKNLPAFTAVLDSYQ